MGADGGEQRRCPQIARELLLGNGDGGRGIFASLVDIVDN